MTTFGHAFDWARRHVESAALPTAVVAVADRTGIVDAAAFGTSEGAAVTVDDPYLLFSITKPLTALTAARAMERGLLTPATALQEAVPGFGANRDDTVRLWHLLSHTSGIGEPPLDPAADLTTELVSRGRDFAAGTMSRYSTLAFTGVARMIEHVTDRSWEAELSVWTSQVGATGLTLDPDAPAHPVADAGAAGVDITRFRSHRNPGAGARGTASDLLAIGTQLLRLTDPNDAVPADERIVHPATLRAMITSRTDGIPRLDPFSADRGTHWGLGWNLRTEAPGLLDRDVFGHGGWAGTEFWVHPTAGIAWVLLTNQALRPGVDIDELDNAIVTAL